MTKEELLKEMLKDEYYGLILPDNDRVNSKLKAIRDAEAKRKNEELKRKQAADEYINKKNMIAKKAEEERRKYQEDMENAQLNYEKCEKAVEEGEGNLYEIFGTIRRNTSPYELAFPNYNMEDGWDFRILTTLLERNSSLLTLSLSRKNLGDIEGKKLADMLKGNKKLRRLELEGNFFGPKTAEAFAECLKVNNTLRYLDLENNMLTNNGKDLNGVKLLFQSLQVNTMLISLNLANNYLTPEVGSMIIDMFRSNKTIINLEFFQNKDFSDRPNDEKKKDENSKWMSIGLYITQIEKIKECLHDNYEAYKKMRTDEWKERKRMTNNYQDTVDTQIIVEANKNLEDTRKKEQEDIEMLYLNNFEEGVKRMEEEFTNKVNEYFQELKNKPTKKKKKKKKK